MHPMDLTTEGVRCEGGLATLENSLVKAEEETSSNNKRFLSDIGKYLKFNAPFKKRKKNDICANDKVVKPVANVACS